MVSIFPTHWCFALDAFKCGPTGYCTAGNSDSTWKGFQCSMVLNCQLHVDSVVVDLHVQAGICLK